MSKKKTTGRFTLNDGTRNSHGFIVASEGIGLERFNENPVMLNDHWSSTSSVIGRWSDLKLVNGKLDAVPEFDMDDEEAAKIAGKVERGYLKGCSMGLRLNPEDFEYINGQVILTKCELVEVSIVAVPSNANALRLYIEDGKPLTDEAVQTLLLSALPVQDEIIVTHDMKKIILSVATMILLGYEAGTTEAEQGELENRIKDLHGSKEAAELKLSNKLQEDEQAKLAAITAKVDANTGTGKLAADKRDQYIALGVANPTLLDTLIEAIPTAQSLGAQVNNAGNNADVKTPADFQKLSYSEQLAWKAANPDAYINLFKK